MAREQAACWEGREKQQSVQKPSFKKHQKVFKDPTAVDFTKSQESFYLELGRVTRPKD